MSSRYTIGSVLWLYPKLYDLICNKPRDFTEPLRSHEYSCSFNKCNSSLITTNTTVTWDRDPRSSPGQWQDVPFPRTQNNHVKFPFFRPVQIEFMKETFLGHEIFYHCKWIIFDNMSIVYKQKSNYVFKNVACNSNVPCPPDRQWF